MESHKKIFVGYLIPFIIGITYFAIKEELIMLIIFGVLGCLGFSFIAIGMVELIKNEDKKVATKLRSGYYDIKSSLVIEIRRGRSSKTYYKNIDEFDLRNAMNTMLDVAVSVRLFLEPDLYGPMRDCIIPAGKIPARLWPLMLPGNTIRVENGFVRDVYKPGEEE